jgi:hypothetical protein
MQNTLPQATVKIQQQPGSSFQDIEDLDWQSQFGTASASLGVLGGAGGVQPREKWIFTNKMQIQRTENRDLV